MIPYDCAICGTTLENKVKYKQHMALLHEKFGPRASVSCGIRRCNRRFVTKEFAERCSCKQPPVPVCIVGTTSLEIPHTVDQSPRPAADGRTSSGAKAETKAGHFCDICGIRCISLHRLSQHREMHLAASRSKDRGVPTKWRVGRTAFTGCEKHLMFSPILDGMTMKLVRCIEVVRSNDSKLSSLPCVWTPAVSKPSGRTYYYDTKSRLTAWNVVSESDTAQINPRVTSSKDLQELSPRQEPCAPKVAMSGVNSSKPLKSPVKQVGRSPGKTHLEYPQGLIHGTTMRLLTPRPVSSAPKGASGWDAIRGEWDMTSGRTFYAPLRKHLLQNPEGAGDSGRLTGGSQSGSSFHTRPKVAKPKHSTGWSTLYGGWCAPDGSVVAPDGTVCFRAPRRGELDCNGQSRTLPPSYDDERDRCTDSVPDMQMIKVNNGVTIAGFKWTRQDFNLNSKR